MPQTSPTAGNKHGLTPMQLEAVQLVRDDVTQGESGVAFITERVAFQIRNLIRTARKNYWGVFDNPVDATTGRRKIWPPLTEVATDNFIKNIDLDTKDINFRAKKPTGTGFTQLTRGLAHEEMSKLNFGEKMDQLERDVAIDGSGIWKITKNYEKGEYAAKNCVDRVDLLNFYIDPTAPNIQDAYSVVERAPLTVNQIMAHSGWKNTARGDVTTSNTLSRADRERMQAAGGNSTGEYAEVFERFGPMPDYFMTGEKPADGKFGYVEGHIVVSNPFNNPQIHMVEKWEGKDGARKWRPYEEAWCFRVPGRWLGRGIPEKLLHLQAWLSAVINIRINKNFLAQIGLLKVKSGSGITTQMLQKLAATGTIVVKNQDDVEQLVINDAGASSYSDETNIRGWTREITSTYEAATGESMPASTPATNAVLASKAAQTQFQMVKEGLGMFQERVWDRHMLPNIFEAIGEGDTLRYTNDIEDFKEVVDRVVAFYAGQQLDAYHKHRVIPTPQEVASAIESAKTKLMNDKTLFFKLVEEIGAGLVDTKMYVTNEELDVNATIQNLMSALKMAPQYADDIIPQVWDLMGLPPPKKLPPPPAPAAPGGPGAPALPPGAAAPAPGPVPSPIQPNRPAAMPPLPR